MRRRIYFPGLFHMAAAITGLFYSCLNVDLEEQVSVLTGTVSEISTHSSRVSGIIVDLGKGINQYGHCWSELPNFDISSSKTNLGSASLVGDYNSNLTDLKPGVKYYVKAYAQSGSEVVYGSEVNFITLRYELTSPLTQNLAAFWKMDEASGIIHDSFNSYDLAPVGVLIYSRNGIQGTSIDFSTTGAYAYRNDITGLIPQGDVFTISYWIYFNELPVGEDKSQQIIYVTNSGTPGYFLSCYYKSISQRLNFYFKTADGGYCETQYPTRTSDLGRWIHVVGVANGIGNFGSLYIDNVKYTSYSSQTGNLLQATGPLYIGNINTVVPVIEANSRIDDVGFWHRALTEEEIAQLFNAGKGLTIPFTGNEK